MYERSVEIAEELVEVEGSIQSKHNLMVSYERLGDICARQGGEKTLERAYEVYEKNVEIATKLAETEQTIAAYDDLAAGLFRMALHPFTTERIRKQYLVDVKAITEILDEKTRNKRYQNLAIKSLLYSKI